MITTVTDTKVTGELKKVTHGARESIEKLHGGCSNMPSCDFFKEKIHSSKQKELLGVFSVILGASLLLLLLNIFLQEPQVLFFFFYFFKGIHLY